MSLGLAASRAMADTLAVLHSLDPEALGLASFRKPGNSFERQLGRLGPALARRGLEAIHTPTLTLETPA